MNINCKGIKIDTSCEWVIKVRESILLDDKEVGYIELFLFNKNSIDETIFEDYPYYISEDTGIYEFLCYFLYKTIKDKDILYVNELMINKEYRRKGIDSAVLNL